MASKYAKRMVVPDGFAELLKHFTGEALRDLPPDIPDDACEEWLLNYGAQFFEAAAEESRAAYGDAGGGGGSTAELARALEAMGPDELRDRITAIFLDADRDGNGFLDAREFKEVVKSFASELGLPLTDVRRIMAEADENADGCIEYHEFVPMAVDIIQMLIAKNKFEESKKAREEDAVTQSRHFLLHGMSGDDLEAVLQEMFRQADVDGSGELSRKEFSKALRESGLGLTRKEINVLLAEVDANEDGMVSYAEFLPLCFNLLVEIVSEEFQSASTPSNEVEIRDVSRAAQLRVRCARGVVYCTRFVRTCCMWCAVLLCSTSLTRTASAPLETHGRPSSPHDSSSRTCSAQPTPRTPGTCRRMSCLRSSAARTWVSHTCRSAPS